MLIPIIRINMRLWKHNFAFKLHFENYDALASFCFFLSFGQC